MKVLFTDGKALYLAEDGTADELPCYRLARYQETVREIRENKAWKSTGQGARFMGVAQEDDNTQVFAHFGGLALYQDEFLYTLTLDASGGLYRRSFSRKSEMEGHICSGNDVRLGEIACHDDNCAACLLHPNGAAHIGLYKLPGSSCEEITDGDSVESAPAWSPDGATLYFSTCGIARDPAGRPAAYSPRVIASYIPDTGRLRVVKEDEGYDYLCPKEDADGCLWYIRQPYRQGEENTGHPLLDTLLFPVRMIKAFGGFLNVFSMRYGGESLRSDGGFSSARSKQKSEKELFFEGNLIHAEKNLRENRKSGDTYPGIIPRSRVLIRCSPDGKEEILEKSVLDFALCPDGSYVFSNGAHILHRTGDGQLENLAKARLACRLQVCP